MQKIKLKIVLSNTERRHQRLVAAGVAPSAFRHCATPRPHRDQRLAERRGERKHKTPWA